MIVPALPAIQRELHTSAANVTWLLTAFLVSASIATPIIGRLGDMYGKERLLLFALLLFGAGNLIAAFGHSLGVYIAGRAVQGMGGAILPLAIGIIRDEFPREKVATGIGTISAMFGIGGGVGLVISGVLVDNLGIDSIFWLGVIASVVAAVGDLALRPRVARPRAGAHRLRRRGAAHRRRCSRCCSASARATRGAGRAPGSSGCSPPRSCSPSSGRGSSCAPRTRWSTCG